MANSTKKCATCDRTLYRGRRFGRINHFCTRCKNLWWLNKNNENKTLQELTISRKELQDEYDGNKRKKSLLDQIEVFDKLIKRIK